MEKLIVSDEKKIQKDIISNAFSSD